MSAGSVIDILIFIIYNPDYVTTLKNAIEKGAVTQKAKALQLLF